MIYYLFIPCSFTFYKKKGIQYETITQKNLEDYDDYEAPDFAIDEFHTFISNFSHTLK